MLEPLEPPNPASPEAPEPAPAAPARDLKVLRWISLALMIVGGVTLVAVFLLWIGVMTGGVQNFSYMYWSLGSFGVYFLGRALGFVRKMIVKPSCEER
jgi:predicted anti-sigma-YlaC factor YlaD